MAVSGLLERSTADLLVLMVAGTICFSVLAAGATVAVLEIHDPSVDTDQMVATIKDIVNTLIGLLAGFLAGRRYAKGDTPDAELGDQVEP